MRASTVEKSWCKDRSEKKVKSLKRTCRKFVIVRGNKEGHLSNIVHDIMMTGTEKTEKLHAV